MARQGNYQQGTQPGIVSRRSKFDLNSQHKTTFNQGQLIPFHIQEVYPGDSHKTDVTQLTRLTTTFIKSPIDNLLFDTYFFFVPHRLTFDKWQELQGENKKTKWDQDEIIEVPQLKFEIDNYTGSIADYFGIPTNGAQGGKTLPTVSALPFRAYALIWNEWFRDQNNQDPILIKTGSEQEQLTLGDFASDNYTGKPAIVNKYHDYFSSCLPAPQKGDPVKINVLQDAPVRTSSDDLIGPTGDILPLRVRRTVDAPATLERGALGIYPDNPNTSGYGTIKSGPPTGTSFNTGEFAPSNLYADLQDASAVSINDLRFAFQLQRLLERDARGGTRYTEIIEAHFGVQSDDARQQRPEFLGGSRNPLNITQVVQNSFGTTGTTPQGNVSAYSLSTGQASYRKAFTEHGYVIGLACIRQKHTYQQGIEKFFFRKTRLDHYNPVFANIGEQPVYSKEIYAYADQSNEKEAKKVFGFNEAFADLRYRPDRISGMLRTSAKEGLDLWHFADTYGNSPVIGDEFLKETPKFLDRTISSPSTQIDQFLVDIYVKNTAIRVLPTYSVPGKIDQN